MNIMFVLLPLAMLGILLVLGALFWAIKVRATHSANAKNAVKTAEPDPHTNQKTTNNDA